MADSQGEAVEASAEEAAAVGKNMGVSWFSFWAVAGCDQFGEATGQSENRVIAYSQFKRR